MESIEEVKIEVEERDDQYENDTKVFVQAQSEWDTFSLSVMPIAAVEALEKIELIDEEEPKQSAHHKRKEERRAIEEKYEDDHGNLIYGSIERL